MRKKVMQGIVIVGALSNAVILAVMEMPVWLIILMTLIYVAIFEALLYVLEPRLVRAERERNVQAYSFYRELTAAKKATVTLRDGTIFYNATFDGYANNRDAKTIVLNVHTVKTKKDASISTKHEVKLIDIKEVKKVQ